MLRSVNKLGILLAVGFTSLSLSFMSQDAQASSVVVGVFVPHPVNCKNESDLRLQDIAYRLSSPSGATQGAEVKGSINVELVTCRKDSSGKIGWVPATALAYSYESLRDGHKVTVHVTYQNPELIHILDDGNKILGITPLAVPSEGRSIQKIDFTIPFDRDGANDTTIRTLFFLRAIMHYQVDNGPVQNAGLSAWNRTNLWAHLKKDGSDWQVDHFEIR
jgi:hypothetical protein